MAVWGREADDWHERAMPFGPGHDHMDVHAHEGLGTANFELLGHDSLVTDYYGDSAGDYLCGATSARDGRRLSVVHSWGSDVAFVLTDTTDLERPRKIGEFVMANTNVYDVTLTADLRFVVLATSVYEGGPETAIPRTGQRVAHFDDSCTGERRPVSGPESGLPWAAGIVLVDISNPRNPFIVDFKAFPVMGGHSVRAHEIDGRTILLITVFSYVHETSYWVLADIADLPGGPRIHPLSIIPGFEQDGEVLLASSAGGAHDGYVSKHPVTGRTTAYLANGAGGLRIYDVEDLSRPTLLSVWKDWEVLGDKTQDRPFLHTTLPAQTLWDDRHYTFIGEECSSRRETMASCVIYTLDTTDPRKPSFVGAWTVPVDVPWERSFEFSTHHFALDETSRTLFIALFHGGVWTVDVSTEEARKAMPSIGVFLPARESEKPPPPQGHRSALAHFLVDGYALTDKPSVADLDLVQDGTLVVFDATSGIYTVSFNASRPAPSPAPWPLGYNET